MTDPAKLADRLIYDGGTVCLRTSADGGVEIYTPAGVDVELLAAALRLAEATATWHQLRRRMMTCDLATTERRQREESDAMDRIVEAVAAYRAAKEEA